VALLVPTLVEPFNIHWYVVIVPLPAVEVEASSVVDWPGVNVRQLAVAMAVGTAFSVTDVAADVVEHPLLLVTITV